MAAAVVDGALGRRKLRIGECADRHCHERALSADFGVEQVGAADRAEPESVARAPVADAQIFGCRTRDRIGRGEGSESSKDAAGATLAGEAVADADADADAQWCAFARPYRMNRGESLCGVVQSLPSSFFSIAAIGPVSGTLTTGWLGRAWRMWLWAFGACGLAAFGGGVSFAPVG